MKAELTQSLYLFMTAMFTSLIMVPFLRKWALDKGIVDVPDARKVHRKVTPRIGGIAIAMAFLFAMLVFTDLSREMRGVLAAVMILFFTGLVDDLVGISPKRKLIGEIGACVTAVVVGDLAVVRLGDLFGFGEIMLPVWLAVPFTVFAVVGVVNAINLIDGLDGLAGGVSVIALTVFFLLGVNDGNVMVMVMCAGLLGALLGFLKYNFFPARIFMGDTGSLVVGGMLAFIAVLLTQQPGSTVNPAAMLIVLGLPIVDTLWVMTRRLLQGRNPFAADRSHIHHKFLDLGFEHRFTVIIIYGLSLFWGVTALLFHEKAGYLLIFPYVILSGLTYLAIRLARGLRSRYSFLPGDSARGIRDSLAYRNIARGIAATTPVISLGLFIFFSTAVLVCVNDPVMPLVFPAVLLSAILGMLFMTRDLANQYVQALLYLAGMVAAFVVHRNGRMEIFDAVTIGSLTDLILGGLALLIAFRLLFRQPGDFFMNTIDYLFLGICLLLLLAAPRMAEVMTIEGALARGVAVAMGLKVVAVGGRAPSRVMAGAVMAMLAVLVVVSV